MSKHAQLQVLREEERVLLKLSTKLNDQLNRLKVEELALMSMIRSQGEPSATQETNKDLQPEDLDDATINTRPLLDLQVNAAALGLNTEEEEEEDDEATEHDQLTTLLQQLNQQNTESND